MASFLDQPYKFNSFVQTTPVEDMIKVGMTKQAQYDEGIQRIQGWIDENAALPVAREVDKGYLQGMLNNLGTELGKVTTADFSNVQLQKSIGGMASKISKDPNILAALESTNNMRNQSQQMAADEQKGTLTPDNE